MIKTYLKYTLTGLLLTAALYSCRVTKPYQQPGINTQLLYRGQNGTDTITIASMHWEQLFTDTTLQSLIREGLANNLNLKVAIQKIAEAQAALGQANGAFIPSLSGNASATHSKQSAAALDFPPGLSINTVTTTYQVG